MFLIKKNSIVFIKSSISICVLSKIFLFYSGFFMWHIHTYIYPILFLSVIKIFKKGSIFIIRINV